MQLIFTITEFKKILMQQVRRLQSGNNLGSVFNSWLATVRHAFL